jgi:hypothetical protein
MEQVRSEDKILTSLSKWNQEKIKQELAKSEGNIFKKIGRYKLKNEA